MSDTLRPGKLQLNRTKVEAALLHIGKQVSITSHSPSPLTPIQIYSRALQIFFHALVLHSVADRGLQLPEVLTDVLPVAPEETAVLLPEALHLLEGSDYARLDSASLGYVYEHLLGYRFTSDLGALERNQANRRKSGSFYTPPTVITAMVESTLDTLLTRQKGAITILDPATGSGNFLLAALRYLTDRAGFDPGQAASCLYGVDCDPLAVFIARCSLWLALAASSASSGEPGQLRDHLRCANTLSGEIETVFPQVVETGGFALVIGNPPYQSFSGRHKVAGQDAAFRSWRQDSKLSGWVTSHGLFMERGIALTRPGGYLSYIIPDQVGHLETYAATRASVAKQSDVRTVCYLGEDVFPDAITPVLIFVVQKREEPFSTKIKNVQKFLFPPQGEAKQDVVPPTRVTQRDGTCHTITLATASTPWVISARESQLVTGTFSLGTAVRDPGVHTGNCASKLLVKWPGEGEPFPAGCVPLLEGKQVQRYSVAEPQLLLNTAYSSEPGEYFRIGPLATYESASCLVRQTASTLIVAPNRHRTYFRNSVLAVYAPPPYHPAYLLALLNSQLLKRWYRSSTSEAHQQAFPQVKVGAIRKLPIRCIAFTTTPAERARIGARWQVQLSRFSGNTSIPDLLVWVRRHLPRPTRATASDLLHDTIATCAGALVSLSQSSGPVDHRWQALDSLVEELITILYDGVNSENTI